MNQAMVSGALSGSAVEAAARQLHALQRGSHAGARLAPPWRPHDASDGWRIQQRVSALRGTPVLGWKCALPLPDRWVVAALHQTLPSGTRLRAPAGPAGGGRIEPEFAVELLHDLPAREQPYTPADVMAAIGAVRLAIEVLGCRYASPAEASGPELMADGLWHQGLVLGADVDTLPAEPTFPLTLDIEGQPERTLTARHPDGDPHLPLYWLADFLRARGLGLQAGQVVITGSLAGVIDVPFGCPAMLRYGSFGSVTLTLDPL